MTSTAQILVVEDEALIADDIQFGLQDLGYHVPSVVASGNDALASVAEDAPNLILMDINIQGDIDGIETANQIRLQHDIPIIFLTAFADDGFLARAKVTNPFGYLLKPFKERELHATIEMALNKHRLEQELKESQDKLKKITEASSDAIIMMDSDDGAITFWNHAAEKLFGYTTAEVMGSAFYKLAISTSEHEIYLSNLQASISTLQEFDDAEILEHTAIDKNGNIFPIEISLSIVSVKGKLHALNIIREISEQKLAQNLMIENETNNHKLSQDLQTLLDTIPNKLLLLDQNFTIVWLNTRVTARSEYDDNDLIGSRCMELWHDKSAPCNSCPVMHTFADEASHENKMHCFDGSYFLLKTFPIIDDTSHVSMVLAILEDDVDD